MNDALRSLLLRSNGVVTWAEGCQVVPPWAIDNARRSGALRRLLPEVYVDASKADDPEVFRRAVLAYAGGRGALSHTTALAVWGLHRSAAGEPVHPTVPEPLHLRSRAGLVVHRLRRFVAEPPHALPRRGLTVTGLDKSLVDSWPVLPPWERRGAVIRAVNDRMTTPRRIVEALAEVPKLTGRAELRTLLDRLGAGCRSPLEIWGHDHVFTGPGMPPFQRQVCVRVGTRTTYLDVYAERERVDFELDGATTHSDPRQREIDLRRDALLATLGILVVRFAHRRLIHETAEVRREILAILAARRARTS